ncbi:MAG: hypothetical protein Q8N15_03050 [Bacillota bacterium]|nr:hypothetical protein [Bacillota bacterium]
MKQESMKTMVRVIAFGALGGLLEATLGYVLHLVHDYLPGLVMPAIGAAILVRLYKTTPSRKAVFAVGVIAAAIKAVDFLIPGMNPLRVANPMLSILMETLVMTVVISLLAKAGAWRRVELQFAVSFGWRLVFIAALFLEFFIFGILSGQITSFAAGAEFVFFNGLMSGAIWIFVDHYAALIPKTTARLFTRPAFAAVLLVIAVAATYFLS